MAFVVPVLVVDCVIVLLSVVDCVLLAIWLRVIPAVALRVHEVEIVGVIVAVILLDVPCNLVSVLDAVRGGDDVAESDPVSDSEHDNDAHGELCAAYVTVGVTEQLPVIVRVDDRVTVSNCVFVVVPVCVTRGKAAADLVTEPDGGDDVVGVIADVCVVDGDAP